MMPLTDNVRLLHMMMEGFANAKRFNERWLADPTFRTTLLRDPDQAVADYHLDVDIDEVRGMARNDTEQAGSIARGIHAITAAKSALMKRWYGPDATAADPNIAAWRSRQQARMLLELGPFPTKSSIRAAWHAELTRGCSGGCWFCNMAAPELTGVAPSGDAALAEWRQLTRILQDRLGPAMRTGFLDGASDPFDHPDYEAFCRILLEEAGFYPPTATALALRDPDRSRRFFAEAKEAGCWAIRLTVRDSDEFNALHDTFSSGELAHVQLNVMTPESTFVYSLAGRYRERFLNDEAFAARERRKLRFAPWYTADAVYRDTEDHPFDSNPGVVGFSINMVDRTLALVAPRSASDCFPLGFEILDRRAFADVDEFAGIFDAMIERWMPVELRDGDPVVFGDGLRCEAIADGVRLHGRFHQFVDITDATHGHLIQALAGETASGRRTLADLAGGHPSDATQVREIAQRLFEAGVLEEVGRS